MYGLMGIDCRGQTRVTSRGSASVRSSPQQPLDPHDPVRQFGRLGSEWAQSCRAARLAHQKFVPVLLLSGTRETSPLYCLSVSAVVHSIPLLFLVDTVALPRQTALYVGLAAYLRLNRSALIHTESPGLWTSITSHALLLVSPRIMRASCDTEAMDFPSNTISSPFTSAYLYSPK